MTLLLIIKGKATFEEYYKYLADTSNNFFCYIVAEEENPNKELSSLTSWKKLYNWNKIVELWQIEFVLYSMGTKRVQYKKMFK